MSGCVCKNCKFYEDSGGENPVVPGRTYGKCNIRLPAILESAWLDGGRSSTYSDNSCDLFAPIEHQDDMGVREGICVGGSLDGKIVQLPTNIASFKPENSSRTYVWEALLSDGPRLAKGYWRDETWELEFALKHLKIIYTRSVEAHAG